MVGGRQSRNMLDLITRILTESWLALGQMAPYLLLGFLVAGVLSVCIPPAWVERHLGRHGLGPVFTASLIGVPLPLCSCGVIPVSASIRRHGASRAATTAFLISTPQTGVDSIAVTYALLGPVFAVFRPLAALLSGFIGGFLVQLFDTPNGGQQATEADREACAEAYCQGRGGRGVVARALQALQYGLVRLPRDIGTALLVGILIAGLMAALVPQGRLEQYVGGGIVAILLLMAVGVPVYVCATASVPIAAGFMHVGASPGAALAFLIAGPATNATALTTIWKVLGRRTTVLYGLTVAASAIAFGLLLDWLIPAVEAPMPPLGRHAHTAAGAGWLPHLSAVLLLAVVGFSFWAAAHRSEAEAGRRERASSKPPMERRLELSVKGMRCSHCAETVRRSLVECEGVDRADVDLERGRAAVVGDNVDAGRLAAAVTALGYSVERVEPSSSE